MANERSTFEFGRGRRWWVIGNPESNRVALFSEALVRQGMPRASVIPWIDWIEGRVSTWNCVRPGDVIRIESPGKDFPVERAILAAGVQASEADGCAAFSVRELAALEFDRGRILCPRQWYLGFQTLLKRIGRELHAIPDIVPMNDATEIAMMFDKPACHGAMSDAGIPVPRSLGAISCFDELIERMTALRIRRVFVKLAHGSSGSGVVAYQTDGTRDLAWTTVEMQSSRSGVILYNTRRLRRITDRGEIALLVDLLCNHRVHVEQWMPKAGMEGMAFDLRVVVIAGVPAHVVARLSPTPVTNLHLLNQRRNSAAVRKKVGEEVWTEAMKSCAATMRLFPNSLYAGIDVLVTADLRRHAILEINAFGDQIPGVLHGGLETYDAEIKAMDARCCAGVGVT